MSLGSVLNQAGAGSYTRDQILTDATKTAYGLTEAATPDDVFNNILLRLLASERNAGIITVTVKTPGGSPLSGVAITNVTDVNGNNVVTNETGSATGFIPVGTSSYSISNYADIVNVSDSQTVATSGIYTGTLTAIPRNFLRITSTSNWRFSANVTRVDVSAAGAGGGGSGTCGSDSPGAGGGGGYTQIQEDVPFLVAESYQAVVGVGGSGGQPASVYTPTASGANGGQSSFLGVIAAGGSPGIAYYNGSSATSGNGNGNGGEANDDGAQGTGTIYDSFTNLKTVGGGGGGGRKYRIISSDEDNLIGGGNGGSPFGGTGGPAWYIATDRSLPSGKGVSGNGVAGGGGGGSIGRRNSKEASGANGTFPAEGGDGYRGEVAIRMHLKVAS